MNVPTPNVVMNDIDEALEWKIRFARITKTAIEMPPAMPLAPPSRNYLMFSTLSKLNNIRVY